MIKDDEIPKYTFIFENRYEDQSPVKTSVSVETESLKELCEAFEYFLLGSGFTTETVHELFDYEYLEEKSTRSGKARM